MFGLQRILSRITGAGTLTFGGVVSADRTQTVQDATGTIALLTGATTQKFTNPVILENSTGLVVQSAATTDRIVLQPLAGGTTSLALTLTTNAVLASGVAQFLQPVAGTISLVETQPCASFQNKLINPRFDIWQRGTSFAAIASGAYSADRWVHFFDGTTVATISRQTLTLGTITNDPEYFLRYQATTAGAGGTFRQFNQRIESVRTLAGKRVQLTFWGKADAARTITPTLNQNFGTGGAPSGSVDTVGTACNLTTSWTQFTQTFSLPSMSGKTEGTNRDGFLQLLFSMPNNVLFTIDFAEVEIKEVAASAQVNCQMEIRPLNIEKGLCQRYAWKSFIDATAPAQNVGTGTGELAIRTPTGASAASYIQVRFPVPMRAAPTFTTYNPSAVNAQARDNTAAADCSAIATSAITESSALITWTNAAGSAAGNDMRIHVLATAEL